MDKTLSKLLIGNEIRISHAPKLQHNGLRDMLVLQKVHVSKRGSLRNAKFSRAEVTMWKLECYKGVPEGVTWELYCNDQSKPSVFLNNRI